MKKIKWSKKTRCRWYSITVSFWSKFI